MWFFFHLVHWICRIIEFLKRLILLFLSFFSRSYRIKVLWRSIVLYKKIFVIFWSRKMLILRRKLFRAPIHQWILGSVTRRCILSNWKEFSLFWVAFWNTLSELLHPRPPNYGHFWADFESFRALWAIQKVNRHERNVMGISLRGVHFEKLRLLICEILHLAKMHQNMYISHAYLW